MSDRKRRMSRSLASAAAGLVMALGVAAQSASALTVQSASGSPGWVSARTFAVAQDTSDSFSAMTNTNAVISLSSLSLYASPASSQTQVVEVTEHVWTHWLNGWIHEGSSTRTYSVAPGAWRTVVVNGTGAPLFGWFAWNPKYLYLPQLEVTWRTSSGAILGHKVINYDAASDEYCATVGCRVNDGWGYSFYTTYVQY